MRGRPQDLTCGAEYATGRERGKVVLCRLRGGQLRRAVAVGRVRIRCRWSAVTAGLVDLAALLLLKATERATLIGMLVLDHAVDFAPFVPLWQVLGDRKTFRITEE